MRVRNELIGGFIHGDVTIQAEAQKTNVDWSICSEPAINARAFFFAAPIAVKTFESPGVNLERANQFGLKVAAATRRMALRQAAPLVDLQNPKLAKLLGIQ